MRQTVTTDFQTVSSAQDLLELNAPSDAVVELSEFEIAQSSDFDPATMSEILQITWFRGFTTSGSGGSSAIVTPDEQGASAAGGSYERNNTTLATGTVTTPMGGGAWQILNGSYIKIFDPPLPISPGVRFVIRISAPADALTMICTARINEYGG